MSKAFDEHIKALRFAIANLEYYAETIDVYSSPGEIAIALRTATRELESAMYKIMDAHNDLMLEWKEDMERHD